MIPSLLVIPLSLVHAQSDFFYADNYSIYLRNKQVLAFQDSYSPYFVYLNATTGNMNLTNCKTEIFYGQTGYFSFTSRESAIITVSSSIPGSLFYLNNWLYNGVTSLVVNGAYTIKWVLPQVAPTGVLQIDSSLYGSSNPNPGVYQYNLGTKIVFIATPNTGFEFNYWLVNGIIKTFNPFTLTLTQDTVITPVFTSLSYSSVIASNLTAIPVWLPTTRSNGYLFADGSNYNAVQSLLSANASYINPSASIVVGQVNDIGVNGLYYIERGFLYFDTSIIPVGANIVNATLHLFIENVIGSGYNLTVQNGQPLYPNATLSKIDYNKLLYFGNYGSMDVSSMWNNAAHGSDSRYTDIPLTDTSIVTPGSFTKICLRTSQDISAVSPTGQKEIYIGSYNYFYEPEISIYYKAESEIKVYTSPYSWKVFIDNNYVGIGGVTIGVKSGSHLISFENVNPVGGVNYKSPSPFTVNVLPGQLLVVNGTYIPLALVPTPSLWGMDFSFIASSIFIPGLITGIISSGFYVAGRKVKHAYAGALIGAGLALAFCGVYQIVPIYIVGLIYAVSGFLIYYLWWKRRD